MPPSLSIDAIRPMNRWNHDRIQPGWVGPVGDVNCQVRLKHSAPELPLRYDSDFSGVLFPRLGQGISDGEHFENQATGLGISVRDSNWQSGRNFKTRRGWIIEDITAPDNLVEPFVSSLGDYTWRDKIATVYEARRTGSQFLPIPGPYQLAEGEYARGGNTVRVTDVVPGDTSPENVMVDGMMDQQQTAGTREAPIPIGAYGRSQGHSEGSRNNGEYSAVVGRQPRGSGIGIGLSKMK